MHGRHDAHGVAAEAEVRRPVVADDPHVALLRDPLLHAEAPVHGIHDQAAQALALEVRRGSHRRREYPRGLAAVARVRASPRQRLHRVVLRTLDRQVVRRHAGQHRAVQKHIGVVAEVLHAVDVRRAPDVGHSAQDGMAGGAGRYDPAGAFPAVATVVVDPRFAQHLLAEPARPGLAAKAPVRVRAVRVALVGEGVRRGAQADDRPPRFDVVHDVLHLLVGELPEPRRDDHEVRVSQSLETRDVRLLLRIDRPRLRVDREQHDALEAVPHGEHLAEHRHRFLGAVLLVAGDQDDLPARAGAVASRVGHPLLFAAECRPLQEGQKHRAQRRSRRKKTIHSHR